MRRHHSPDDQHRFEGQLRHYHRSNTDRKKSWDEWVDGAPTKPKRFESLGKVLAIAAAILALAGVIFGLYFELR